MKEIGIYIHIPFCIKKCKYCDFVSFENKLEQQEEYVNAILNEIENCKYNNFKVNTIYFGGGTPSVISSKLIIKILNKVREKFIVEDTAEITIEVNPGTADNEKLKDYIENGFNRISIGLQAVQNNLLKTIGRIHTYEEFEKCFHNARALGYKNINVDLMLALPNQTIENLKESLNKVINLSPNHISLYSLILEENTPLEKEIKSGMYTLPSDNEERKMYHITKRILEKNGYIHYEISNFAKRGFESKHNLNCWNQEEYLGFGLSAHSYFDKIRFSNSSDLKNYIEIQNQYERKISIENKKENKAKKDNVQINEVQTEEMQKKEYMMLGLRKIQGVSISEFERKFEINPLFYFRFEIAKLVENELIEVDLDNIKLTKKGLDFANLVFEEFV